MNQNDTILKFLAFLAELRTTMRQVHLYAEASPLLRDVSTTVIPFKSESSEYADDGVTISIALNAGLHKPVGPEKKAIGISLLLRRVSGMWVAEAEVGWSGEEIGWDSFDSREARVESIEEMITAIPPLAEWLGTRFREEVARLPN